MGVPLSSPAAEVFMYLLENDGHYTVDLTQATSYSGINMSTMCSAYGGVRGI